MHPDEAASLIDPYQRGQASVEFALILPVIALAAWAVVAVGTVTMRQLEVMNVARVAARTAAVEPGSARTAALAATDLRPLGVEEEVTDGLIMVTVRFTHRVPVPLPVGWRPDLTLEARVVMNQENPR